MSHAAITLRRFLGDRRTTVGSVVLGMLSLAGIFAEVLAAPAPLLVVGPGRTDFLPAITEQVSPSDDPDKPYGDAFVVWPIVRSSPTASTPEGPFAPSSPAHPLGTDEKGRDVFARVVYGARNALGISVVAIFLSTVFGVFLGGLSGIRGGVSRTVLVRLVEAVDSFPAIIVVALVWAIERQPTSLSLILAVAFVRWAEIARLVHAESMRATSEDYALAARALGASRTRIFMHHVLPNALGPVTVSSVFGVASVVLLNATLAFLNMGTASDSASWGELLAQGARHPAALRLLLLPGVLLFATVGASYLLADALRDAMDPRAAHASANDVTASRRVSD
jgi:peptide/nickel transport system permease protein